MPRLHLTKPVVDELKLGASDVVYWDDNLSGFGVKVTPKGRKVFICDVPNEIRLQPPPEIHDRPLWPYHPRNCPHDGTKNSGSSA